MGVLNLRKFPLSLGMYGLILIPKICRVFTRRSEDKTCLHVLIIDELGYMPVDREKANLFF